MSMSIVFYQFGTRTHSTSFNDFLYPPPSNDELTSVTDEMAELTGPLT